MNESSGILLEGLNILRKNNAEIDNLLAPSVVPLLNRYINEIETFNPAYGLVGTNDRNELVIKHILDSLAPLGIIYNLLKTKNESIADAGSGAGLPGIPLAIALQKCSFTLIERMGRRAGFLLNTKAVLSLSNINIEEKELEKASGKFDLITFRAFKPLDSKLLKTLFKLCAPAGHIAAYKGRREKIEAEMKPLQADWQIIPCQVPFLDEERHLLVIKKELLNPSSAQGA
ncbi:MAG: 16S rRNA (guanine(527)-N(7))-methyltransferase RsmG [Treponema sp.]|nr:16S rRNA (guanine(527)-N(7))-methyltransferase RsmG [Treponema sp.]